MKFSQKFILSTMLMTMLCWCSTNQINAEECCIDNGGCGYDECTRTSSLAPAIALGTIVLVAVIAVAVQNTSGHAHCHAH